MKFGQFIQYDKRNIFLKKLYRKWGMETSSRPPFFKKALYEAKASGLQYDVRIYWHVLDKRVSHAD